MIQRNTPYRLLLDRFDYKAGTIVYLQCVHDYGLSRDDTMATGEEHVTMTPDPKGGYPGFTVPVRALAEEPSGC